MFSAVIRSTLLCVLVFLNGLALAADLQAIENVRLVPAEWADGDSFLVRFPDGSEHTLRLYGADCLEWHVTDGADARRLRAQRRYFGISGYGGTPTASIELAKSLGEAAAVATRSLLAEPFTVHTAFSDAKGDGRYRRIFAFVTTAQGEDLATSLVSAGHARAFGVYRATPKGLSKEDYRDVLRDSELLAANKRKGVWAYTDWDALAEERRAERVEDSEARIATGHKHPKQPTQMVDVNSAARDELMGIPRVGEATANAIIEGRPYQTVEDLLRVRGIGEKMLEKIRPWVKISP
ncbi:helix-hairpin-helix domain-containing protein [Candidatus Thiodictyon syntrophicum]|jgi:competence ComEA-like helix-hairpin-helix protein|nr:helix-hairpin-helix domain-containing protein [Candidatus Thiodictyon syntrophicum]